MRTPAHQAFANIALATLNAVADTYSAVLFPTLGSIVTPHYFGTPTGRDVKSWSKKKKHVFSFWENDVCSRRNMIQLEAQKSKRENCP